MQISGVNFTLTFPLRLCLLRVLLGTTDRHCSKLSPFQAHWGRWHCTCFLSLVYLFTAHVGTGSTPSPVEFSSHRSWLLGVCHHSCLLRPACLFTVPWGISPLPPSVLRVPHPLFYVSFLLLLFSIQFFFSPGWGSVCPGGYADLAQDCLWEYHMPLSSPCGLHLSKPSGHWCLVVAWEPSWFLHLTWSGDAMHRLGVWRSQSFASSQWFFL
jgi:hypothetical protein